MTVTELLHEKETRVLLDVRSPGEYAQGRIPGAQSFPLFSNEERAQVGITYKQKGKEAAFLLGLHLTGPKMAGFVETAQRLAPHRQIAVHCWRGGQRSQSMGWLLRQAGFDVKVLQGGYKQYRRHVLDSFAALRLPLIVVGGSTGSGKTKIIHALRAAGEQVVDLEALACHKGSAFGFIGEAPQPSVEQFENDLYEALRRLDPQRRVWIENESRSIGRVFIPDDFWAHMKVAPLVNVEIPHQARIQNLLDDYVLEQSAELETAFRKLEKRLGGLQLKNALEALQRGDFAAAAEIALAYYDKTYQHCLDVNVSPDIRFIRFEDGDPAAIAAALRSAADEGFASLEARANQQFI